MKCVNTWESCITLNSFPNDQCMVLGKSGKVQDRTMDADFMAFLSAFCLHGGSTAC